MESLNYFAHSFVNIFEGISVLSVIWAPKLDSIIRVGSNHCQMKYKDDFCASFANAPGKWIFVQCLFYFNNTFSKLMQVVYQFLCIFISETKVLEIIIIFSFSLKGHWCVSNWLRLKVKIQDFFPFSYPWRLRRWRLMKTEGGEWNRVTITYIFLIEVIDFFSVNKLSVMPVNLSSFFENMFYLTFSVLWIFVALIFQVIYISFTCFGHLASLLQSSFFTQDEVSDVPPAPLWPDFFKIWLNYAWLIVLHIRNSLPLFCPLGCHPGSLNH